MTRGYSYYLFVSMVFLWSLFLPKELYAKTEHEVYFSNTDYELNVFKIYGREKGKTLMIIGGIQGDEPGGYLAADLYTDMALKKGNLIVVPRANFLSIIENKRAINADMNRRFQPVDQKINYEDKVVNILKELISKSDYLLNLHEGSGFFCEQWESNIRNPMRFGQSIIADAETYYSKKQRKELPLGETARKIAGTVNTMIDNPNHHFRFNNHRTFDKDTNHSEQRNSASFYALSTNEIPAFGVETSKEIKDLEAKVRYQTMIINAFMDEFGLVSENPKVALEPPKLKYLGVSVNGSPNILLQDGGELDIKKGDRIKISDVVANYQRGISVDVVGVGTANDYQKEFSIMEPTKIVVKKDGFGCGAVGVSFGQKTTTAGTVEPIGFKYLIVEVNGLKRMLSDGERLKVVKGDMVKLLNVVLKGLKEEDVTVNFLGFVGDKRNNTGEDRGYTINTATDLMTKYSKDGLGRQFPVVVSYGSKRIEEMLVEMDEPKMEYIAIKHGYGIKRWYSNGDTLNITPGDSIEIADVKTNVPGNLRVTVDIKGYSNSGSKNWKDKVFHFDKGPLKGHIDNSEAGEILVTREGIYMGKTSVKVSSPLAAK